MKENERVRFIQGNEAIAEGALAAGARFFAGYPITPSSEIAEISSNACRRLGVYMCRWRTIGSIAAVIGASAAGKAYTATSGPGFSLMQENLALQYGGDTLVIINVQRSGQAPGLPQSPPRVM